MIDHFILSADWATATGVTAILTMADSAGTMVVGKRVSSTNGQEAAKALLLAWIAYFGAPKSLRMDQGSGLIAPVSKFCATLFGVQHMDIGAADEHEHQSMVENVHKDLNEAFERAWLKGEARTEADVDIVVALWMIKKNQLDVQHATTRFERTFGQQPVTMMHVLDAVPVMPSPTMTVDDAAFVRILRRHILSMLSEHYAAKSVTSRKNLLHKDVKFASSKGKVDDIRNGMFVSHDGKRWQVINLAGHSSAEPTKALLRRTTHDSDEPVEKVALLQDISQLADPNPDTHIPRMLDLPEPGDFVMYEDCTGYVVGGKLTDISDTDLMLHQYYPSATYTHWQPVWQLEDGTLERKKAAPAGSEAKLETFTADRLLAVGAWQSNGMLSPSLTNELIARELISSDTSTGGTHTASGDAKVVAAALSYFEGQDSSED